MCNNILQFSLTLDWTAFLLSCFYSPFSLPVTFYYLSKLFPFLLDVSKPLRSRSWLFAPEFSRVSSPCVCFSFSCLSFTCRPFTLITNSHLLSLLLLFQNLNLPSLSPVLGQGEFPHSLRCNVSLRSRWTLRKVFIILIWGSCVTILIVLV